MGASAHKVIPYVNGKYGGFGSACAYAQSDLGLAWLPKCSVSGLCGIVNGLSLCDADFFLSVLSVRALKESYTLKKVKVFLCIMLLLFTVCCPYMFCVHMDQKVYCILE